MNKPMIREDVHSMDNLQDHTAAWVVATFGEAVLYDVQERISRVVEEALELAQSEGMDKDQALRLIDYVFSRPKGDPIQEAGGATITIMGYAACKGFSLKDAVTAGIIDCWARRDSIIEKHVRKVQQGVSEISGVNAPQMVD